MFQEKNCIFVAINYFVVLNQMIKALIAIFLGGGAGSVMRYCVQLWLHEKIVPYSFPWATFIVNIIGCFMIGSFYALSARFSWSPEIRLLLTVGLCGGFTTFSTFSNDIAEMCRQGEILLVAVYAALSLILGIAAVVAGSKFY